MTDLIARQQELAEIREHLRRNANTEGMPPEQVRQALEDMADRIPPLPGARIEPFELRGLRAEWVDASERPGGAPYPDDAPDSPASHRGKGLILYMHGGGFTAGSCRFYRDTAARISRAAGVPVVTFEYRLAPEHPYPAANDDCLAVCRWLLDHGYSPERLVLGGDSVGASLVLMTLLALRNEALPLPAGAFLLSPHTDLVRLDGESYRTRAADDPTGSLAGNAAIRDAYLAGWPGEPPAILSPLRLDAAGLPPLLIQAGDREVLLSDAVRYAEHARQAGVPVTLDIGEGLWSAYPLYAWLIPEAERAIAQIGRHAARWLGAGAS